MAILLGQFVGSRKRENTQVPFDVVTTSSFWFLYAGSLRLGLSLPKNQSSTLPNAVAPSPSISSIRARGVRLIGAAENSIWRAGLAGVVAKSIAILLRIFSRNENVGQAIYPVSFVYSLNLEKRVTLPVSWLGRAPAPGLLAGI
ncbi:hypothetical protein CCM_08438 [Cordyceps militaris CM01]|uniref:Uncharacterized protein n=1 Tax=Cordyceps militaris (strain CM01) TaxID=983644 RepID=G3JR99_CORMM|nr:uncharacterized protein CCM_08438 [Cordyceps militaris CM01]EGX88395.1 hypothetical protein CCM_08438 [Cordyceps militaris CM01]